MYTIQHTVYGHIFHWKKIKQKNMIVWCAITHYESIALNPILAVIGYLDVYRPDFCNNMPSWNLRDIYKVCKNIFTYY